jgi:hypothetical protein
MVIFHLVDDIVVFQQRQHVVYLNAISVTKSELPAYAHIYERDA